MKWVVGIVCVGICTFFGYLLSDKYLKRKNFFANFSSFNKKFITEVNFSRATLIEIIKGMNGKNDDFYLSITPIINNQKPNFSYSYLKKEEKEFINKYFDSIIGVDEQNLSNHLNYSMEKIGEFYNNSIIEEKKYRTLYIKLGFLIGLIALIILI